MEDEIQPATVGSGAGVATEAVVCNGDDEDGELFFRSGCQDWTAAQYIADYPTSFDARRFSAMFYDERYKVMFGRRGSQRDTDTGT